jgi:hypothetical protein
VHFLEIMTMLAEVLLQVACFQLGLKPVNVHYLAIMTMLAEVLFQAARARANWCVAQSVCYYSDVFIYYSFIQLLRCHLAVNSIKGGLAHCAAFLCEAVLSRKH